MAVPDVIAGTGKSVFLSFRVKEDRVRDMRFVFGELQSSNSRMPVEGIWMARSGHLVFGVVHLARRSKKENAQKHFSRLFQAVGEEIECTVTDVEDAYWNVPIAPAERRYFTCQVRKRICQVCQGGRRLHRGLELHCRRLSQQTANPMRG